jgi:lipid-A-disaccharide synthase
MQGYTNVSSVHNETYALLARASAALVTSGTATLETALFGVPQVVCYKASPITFAIAKRLVNIKYISLVNLIMDKPVVTELIQDDLSVPNLVKELKELTENEERVARMHGDYDALRHLLQQGGNASAKAAKTIVEFLKASSVQSV